MSLFQTVKSQKLEPGKKTSCLQYKNRSPSQYPPVGKNRSPSQYPACGGIILPMCRPRPLLPVTGRPWRNRTLASQPRPQSFMRHGETGLCTVCKKILSTRHNNKYVEIVSGRWTAALFRSAGGSHPQNTKATSKKIDERHSMSWY